MLAGQYDTSRDMPTVSVDNSQNDPQVHKCPKMNYSRNESANKSATSGERWGVDAGTAPADSAYYSS
ncbi:hypothetical protein CANTEDRAFT_114613 [Yamadazyma tenuis ATCC 10573]|uniref:Uncharacterized protein n=1 Tax=Candida tenuis (strain ATCC 10573 / BCRC 21748 / CBS 615 / JCM 9827 / NBRC 10315 / NRRL Y-1498 / VKM Y-70) TaxID=590646 RepID=G3B5W2_CANTC|nr:uncharacterized protein CANTEDRAFT_114613 [Yamadazyma tenuis ATCC 10573]EGV63318.1 hypothetical protein CANTEDRAFT_114613 [Yamadazyma tenuis ATCC 10573]